MALKPSVVILFSFLFFGNTFSSDMDVGSSCTLEDGTNGVCLEISDCYQVNQNLEHFSLPKFCSYNISKPTICCPFCKFIESRFLFGLNLKIGFHLDVTITDSGESKYERIEEQCLENLSFACNKYEKFKDLDASVKCYEIPHSTEDVVAGGYDAKKHGYPHMVLIGFGENPNNAVWTCSGAIISQNYILSAAHCSSKLALGMMKLAAMGITNKMDHPRQIYEVVKTIVHPGYQTTSKYDDIALLRTGSRIRYNHAVIPACLHRGMEKAEKATAIGWGAMGHRNTVMDIWNGMDIWKFSDHECMESYPEHRFMIHGYNNTTQVCYGDAEQIQDSCEGDKGGPLQIRSDLKRPKCLHTIIGVAAYGRACGNFGSAALYTRVAPYVPWIESITGKLN